MQKENRLAKKADYNRVYRHGKSIANHQFVMYLLPQPRIEHFRLGISVSKKVGNAVVRNRIRRLVKEVARIHKDKINPHVDLIFIARKPAADLTFHDVEKSLLHLLWKSSQPAEGKNGFKKRPQR